MYLQGLRPVPASRVRSPRSRRISLAWVRRCEIVLDHQDGFGNLAAHREHLRLRSCRYVIVFSM